MRWRLIEPEREIDVGLESFTPRDIAAMIEQGRTEGRRAMAGDWHTAAVLGRGGDG